MLFVCACSPPKGPGRVIRAGYFSKLRLHDAKENKTILPSSDSGGIRVIQFAFVKYNQ